MVKLFKKSADKAFVDVSNDHIKRLTDRLSELDPDDAEYTDLCNTIQYIREQRELFEKNKPKKRGIRIRIGGELLAALIGGAVSVWTTQKVLDYEKDDNILTDTQKRVVHNGLIPKKWF